MAKPWAKAFYKSKAWRCARHEALRRDHYTCCDCYARAQEVHHITELNPQNIQDPSIALNLDNLMSLCSACHKKRTQGEIQELPDEYVFDEDGQVSPRAET